jgi:hypothetical protein
VGENIWKRVKSNITDPNDSLNLADEAAVASCAIQNVVRFCFFGYSRSAIKVGEELAEAADKQSHYTDR